MNDCYIGNFCSLQAESRRRLGQPDTELDSTGKRKASRESADPSSGKRSRTAAASPRYTSDAIDDLSLPSSPEDLTPDYSDDDDVYRPPREPRPAAASRAQPPPSFTNALIRAGSRSTRDSSLDKSRHHHQPTAAAAQAPPPAAPVIVKKQPGLLLQAAGKGLLNTTPTSALLAGKRDQRSSDAEFDDLLRPKAPTISFGLYGGHLSIDENAEERRGGGGLGGGIAGLLRGTGSTSSSNGGGGGGHSAIEEGSFVSLLSKVS
jgi:hypothetical protein